MGFRKVPMEFSKETKRLCWDRAELAPGRDPYRWRKDAVGNLVGRIPSSPNGIINFSYDAIIPLSKGGKAVADNCQLLQTVVHRWKVENPEADMTELALHSYDCSFTDEQIDFLEMAFYGDVVRIAEDGTARSYVIDLSQYCW